jgi:hypothetical protein
MTSGPRSLKSIESRIVVASVLRWAIRRFDFHPLSVVSGAGGGESG